MSLGVAFARWDTTLRTQVPKHKASTKNVTTIPNVDTRFLGTLDP